MYRPLFAGWVQAVAMFLSAGATPASILTKLLLKVILVLESHGLWVCVERPDYFHVSCKILLCSSLQLLHYADYVRFKQSKCMKRFLKYLSALTAT